MLPKNSKHFIKPTADELDCSPELVDDAVSFFYSELRKNLIDMTGPNIQIENLGSFKTKPNELPKLIVKYQTHLDVLKPETFNQMKLQKDLETKLEKVLGLQKQINSEKFRKTKFMQAKDERKLKQNMEQPKGDS
jgi:nucleoid DNA-binding protein